MNKNNVTKEFLKKRESLLHTAIELLVEEGFEKFSVNKVISKSGMSKGSFFHYYSSKNELIDGIMDEILNPMLEVGRNILNEDISAKDKILKIQKETSGIRNSDTKIKQQLIMYMQKPENELLLQKVMNRSVESFTPIYEQIIIEGNKSGEFNIEFPHGSAFSFLSYLLSINKEMGKVMYQSEMNPLKYQEIVSKINAFEKFTKQLFNFEEDQTVFNFSIKK